MLSALKTAVGFLAVPMLLLLVFGMGGSRREEGGGSSASALEKAQRPGQPVGQFGHHH